MDAQAKQNQKDRVFEVRGSPVLTKKEKREAYNAYRRTEEYRAKRRATRDLSKDRERWAKYYEANKEQLLERAKEYSSRPEVKEYKREYRRKEYVEKGKQRGLNGIKNLTDTYVKGVLTKNTQLSYKDIPKEMIEAKRFEMLIKRDYLANTTPSERYKESRKKYNARNPNANKKYYQDNKEKLAEAAKRWREKNKERLLTKNYSWREANKERVRELERVRYYKNRDKQLERGEKYRKANKEKLIEKSRERYAKNKEEINAKRRNLTPEQREHINALARAAVKRRKLLNEEK
jgi:hypothetical protein